MNLASLNLHVIRAMLDRFSDNIEIRASAAQVSAYHSCLVDLLPGKNETFGERELRQKLARFYTKKDVLEDKCLDPTEVVFIQNGEVVGKIVNLPIPLGYETMPRM